MTFKVEDDRVIFFTPEEEDETKDCQSFGFELVWGEFTATSQPEQSEHPEEAKLFLSQFDIVAYDALENEDFYQGRNLVNVIKRKSDGRLFGFHWWYGGGKYGEPFVEANGDEHGFDYGDFVFEPVEQYSIPAYKFVESA